MYVLKQFITFPHNIFQEFQSSEEVKANRSRIVCQMTGHCQFAYEILISMRASQTFIRYNSVCSKQSDLFEILFPENYHPVQLRPQQPLYPPSNAF